MIRKDVSFHPVQVYIIWPFFNASRSIFPLMMIYIMHMSFLVNIFCTLLYATAFGRKKGAQQHISLVVYVNRWFLYVGKSALYFRALENVLFSILNFFLASLFLPLRSHSPNRYTCLLYLMCNCNKKYKNRFDIKTRGTSQKLDFFRIYLLLLALAYRLRKFRSKIYVCASASYLIN